MKKKRSSLKKLVTGVGILMLLILAVSLALRLGRKNEILPDGILFEFDDPIVFDPDLI